MESWSYTFEQFAAQATCIDLPSNGVVTSNESNDHREIDTWAIVESAATCPNLLSQMGDHVSKRSVVSNRCNHSRKFEWYPSNRVVPIEGDTGSLAMTEEFCLDLHSDKKNLTIAVISDPVNNS